MRRNKLATVLVLGLCAGTNADVCGEKIEWKQWFGECEAEGAEFSEASTCSCKGDLPHGNGWMRETGLQIYSGPMVDGKMHGFGQLRTSHALVYKGDFADDKKNGEGHMTLSVGSYTGEYKDDLPHGIGMSVDSTDKIYYGEYVNGTREGYGVLDFGRIGVYYGAFKQGIRAGCGTLERGDGLEVQVLSAVLGKTREGIWAPCNRKKQCRSGLYCVCDTDSTRLLNRKPEQADCVAKAKEAALAVKGRVLELTARIHERVEGAVFAAAKEPFLNFTAEQRKNFRMPRRSKDEQADDEQTEAEMAHGLMSDMIVFTAILSLFQFLKQMFEGTNKMPVVWALLGCALFALYEKAVGLAYTWRALVVTYKVFADLELDDEDEFDIVSALTGHTEL